MYMQTWRTIYEIGYNYLESGKFSKSVELTEITDI